MATSPTKTATDTPSVFPLFQPRQISAFSNAENPDRLILAIFASSRFHLPEASMLRRPIESTYVIGERENAA